MVSLKQIEANRLNAQKSTGSKTPEGKAKVSQNPVTHGLTSKRPVLDIEDTAEFRQFANEMLDQLDPTNPMEFFFSRRSVCQAWRIQRAQCYETLILDNLVSEARQQHDGGSYPICQNKANLEEPSSVAAYTNENPVDSCGTEPDSVRKTKPISGNAILGKVLTDDFRNHRTLEKVARYETRLECSMLRCLREFRQIRGSQMMNFSSLRQYVRDFQPRPKDFMDDPQNKPNSQNKPNLDTPSVTPVSPDTPPCTPELDSAGQTEDSELKTENPSEATPFDSFKHWKELYCAPRGENIDYDKELEFPLQHRPNLPKEGDYIYCKNWQHRILRMVEYPWKKRRKLDEAELTELVDPILMDLPNPLQFLWDFNLIELTAEAYARRQNPALAV